MKGRGGGREGGRGRGREGGSERGRQEGEILSTTPKREGSQTLRAFCRLDSEVVMAEVSRLNLSISCTSTVFILSP